MVSDGNTIHFKVVKEMKTEIGKLLKDERIKRSLTQEQTATLLGISRSYYADLETGRYFPSGRLIMKLNDVFNLFYLIENDGNTIHLKSSKGGE